MTENRSIENGKREVPDDKTQVVITEFAGELLKSIENILAELVSRIDLSPADDEFYLTFCKLFNLYDLFQNEIIDASGINVVCKAGCSNCCCHWVDDVNSFEVMIIIRYLAINHPEIIDSIAISLRKDMDSLTLLKSHVDEKVTEYSFVTDDLPDKYDLLLLCFYQLERQCALLDDNGRCVVYPVRPFTCRDYINISDPSVCHPDRINEEEPATLILHLSDKVSQLLEILHHRFNEGNPDMSLRSRLLSLLESMD